MMKKGRKWGVLNCGCRFLVQLVAASQWMFGAGAVLVRFIHQTLTIKHEPERVHIMDTRVVFPSRFNSKDSRVLVQ